jgi:hypothetical protein
MDAPTGNTLPLDSRSSVRVPTPPGKPETHRYLSVVSRRRGAAGRGLGDRNRRMATSDSYAATGRLT